MVSILNENIKIMKTSNKTPFLTELTVGTDTHATCLPTQESFLIG